MTLINENDEQFEIDALGLGLLRMITSEYGWEPTIFSREHSTIFTAADAQAYAEALQQAQADIAELWPPDFIKRLVAFCATGGFEISDARSEPTASVEA